jgi:DNA-binding transcriptional regulator PaaX
MSQADHPATITVVHKHLMDTIAAFDMDEAAVGAAMGRGVAAGWLVQEGEDAASATFHLKAPVQTPDRATNDE